MFIASSKCSSRLLYLLIPSGLSEAEAVMLNILLILVTYCVSIFDKFTSLRFGQFANILLKSLGVTPSNKLPKSRMQRDLSDSSSQRNIGLAFGYSLQAITQTIGGLKKVHVNEEKIMKDLESKWEVLAEPIQTILRKYGIPDAYNQLKKLTRGKEISKEDIQKFINSLDVLSDEDKLTLLNLTPSTYIGLAKEIV